MAILVNKYNYSEPLCYIIYDMKGKIGKITIEGGANVWPHEIETAKALVNIGLDVKFIPSNNSMCSADAYLNRTIFEFKAPEGTSIKSVERNLIKAINNQSPNVVLDSVRMKNVRDESIKNFLITKVREKRGLKRVYFVNRKREVIDINKIV